MRAPVLWDLLWVGCVHTHLEEYPKKLAYNGNRAQCNACDARRDLKKFKKCIKSKRYFRLQYRPT